MRFCDIQNNQGRGKGYQPKLKLELITLSETLIMLDIYKKTNLIVFIINYTLNEKNGGQFYFFTEGKQHKTCELDMITSDLECP